MAPSKKKAQKTIASMFGWSAPSRGVDIDLNEDLDILGEQPIPLDDSNRKSEIASQGSSTKRKFREAWKKKFPWLRHILIKDNSIMKCEYYERYGLPEPFGTGSGCVNIQHDSLVTHVASSSHRIAIAKWTCEMEKKVKSIPEHASLLANANMERIITTMKIIYFIAQKDLSISSYEDMCAFALTMKMANMPKSLEYSSQTSSKKKGAYDSPFFSIMIDESNDRSLELHLIIYCVYLTHDGRGKKVSEFMGITCINDGRGKTIYDAIKSFLIEKGHDLQKLIGIATDGASAMIGSEIGLISFLKKDYPSFIAIHCIAHREALAIADASKGFAELLNVEKLANKVYSWINNSSKRNKELMELLELMEIDANRVLQMYLKVVNALNQKLQDDIIDLTSIGTAIGITIRQLYRSYINCDNFGNGSFLLTEFLNCSKYGYLELKDSDGCLYRHELIYDVLQRCIMMEKSYVQAIVDGLNSHFVDLPLLNASKLFSPVHYEEDALVREQNAKLWLERLLQHLLDFRELSEHALYSIDKRGCEQELYSFVDNLFMNCEGFTMKEAWRYFSSMKDWHASFPNLMKLWRAILVIPASTIACERGFSKQNLIKSDRRSSLIVNTLDHLMRVSTIGPNIDEVDWNRVFELWKESKSRRMYDL
ncbi:hypothetical protein KP509_02G093100 [Ceratopteris richardii]|uniref:Transposase n=1 Tax=Ceratopteris richardii TaxID=49495 RepID=A0A8T2VFN2_CERRI|nr:hypothetical protein KP509_02G093100 [Ceratopteris richardii]